jgi:hypothetical protein
VSVIIGLAVGTAILNVALIVANVRLLKKVRATLQKSRDNLEEGRRVFDVLMAFGFIPDDADLGG